MAELNQRLPCRAQQGHRNRVAASPGFFPPRGPTLRLEERIPTNISLFSNHPALPLELGKLKLDCEFSRL